MKMNVFNEKWSNFQAAVSRKWTLSCEKKTKRKFFCLSENVSLFDILYLVLHVQLSLQ